MQVLGYIFIGISIFGWFGFWFAGSGHAFLIAFGFLVAGIALLGNNKKDTKNWRNRDNI